MRIVGHLQEMSVEEIKKYIDPVKYNEIKNVDDKPVFKAYVIGHEGESKGRLVGIGEIIKRWVKRTIQNMYEKLKIGTKVFYLHGRTNDHSGREAIGEIVGKALKKIGNKLSTIGIVYLKPGWKDKNLDVASIEADILLDEETKEVELEKITGVALGNSAVNKPGFAGATLIASLQEFIPENKIKTEVSFMTLDEIKQSIKAAGFKPSDVFEKEILIDDPIMKGYVKEKVAGEFYHRKRTDEKFDEERKKWEEEKKKYEELLKEKEITLAKITAKEKLQEIVKTRKLDEKQAKYIEKDFSKFKLENPEKLEEELNKFVDSSLDDYEKTMEILGLKKEDDKKGNEDDKPGAGADEGDKNIENDEDYVDPEKNDFIPTD